MLASCTLQPQADSISFSNAKLKKSSAIQEQFTIPFDDVSGIALRRGVGGVGLELIAVSDKSFSLAMNPISEFPDSLEFEFKEISGTGL
jgi:hypothetical protein